MRLKVDEKGVLYIPNRVTEIHEKEFANREDIKKVVFNTETRIVRRAAFSGCENLEEVVFPPDSKCLLIESEVFSGDILLKKAILPLKIKKIGRKSFWGCNALKEIYFPYNLQEIAPRAFEECRGLIELNFANSKINVAGKAFAACVNIKKVRISTRIYTAFPFHNAPGLILHSLRYKDFYFYKMKAMESIAGGEIKGRNYYVCFGPDRRMGEGIDVREAYNDYVFYHERPELCAKLKPQISLDTRITPFQYRILSGSCNFGVRDFCKIFRIDFPDGTRTIRELASIMRTVSTDETMEDFLAFVKELEEKETQTI